jgi:tripartite-type tricarboxylate transporter receptor subunit TctC
VTEGMRVSLRQPIIIENVTSAGGTIGVGRVARPSGYLGESWIRIRPANNR